LISSHSLPLYLSDNIYDTCNLSKNFHIHTWVAIWRDKFIFHIHIESKFITHSHNQHFFMQPEGISTSINTLAIIIIKISNIHKMVFKSLQYLFSTNNIQVGSALSP
jgi:hypothetical protein